MAQVSDEVVDNLKELCDSLEDLSPAVPDELTRYVLRRSGFICTDVRTLRLVSLAAQRFVASVLEDAANIAKRRRLAPAAHLRAEGYPRERVLTLTTEDVAEALGECGVTVKPTPYFVDPSGASHEQ